MTVIVSEMEAAVSKVGMGTYIWSCPNKFAVLKHILCPNLAGVVVLEPITVILKLEVLFQHNVSSTFERATPFTETLGDLSRMVSDGGQATNTRERKSRTR